MGYLYLSDADFIRMLCDTRYVIGCAPHFASKTTLFFLPAETLDRKTRAPGSISECSARHRGGSRARRWSFPPSLAYARITAPGFPPRCHAENNQGQQAFSSGSRVGRWCLLTSLAFARITAPSFPLETPENPSVQAARSLPPLGGFSCPFLLARCAYKRLLFDIQPPRVVRAVGLQDPFSDRLF
ncbi:hypothetical protein RKD52_004432 [Metabacillus sp. SLBN-84]